MRRHSFRWTSTTHALIVPAAMCIVSARSFAQATPGAGPAPRTLPTPSVTSPRFAGNAFSLIALANGTLLVNDIRNHRVMLSDSLLRVTSVVIDTAEYGARPASILRYRGDSIVFVESVTPSMTMIDPAGKVVRTMAVPRPRDVAWLMPSPGSSPGVDSRGGFVHRGLAPRVVLPKIKPNEVRPGTSPDASPIVRDNPTTHAGDTIAWIKSYTSKSVQLGRSDGTSFSYSRQRPVDIIDDWVVLANGTVAVVRGQDYRVDFIDADGKVTVGQRIPYDWKHLSDDAKVALADSSNAEYNEGVKSRAASQGGGSTISGGSTSAGGAMGGGTGNNAGGMQDRPLPPPGVMDFKPAELPDYRPAFLDGAVRADAEGNVWIRTQTLVADTTKSVHDIVNGAGKLIDRVLVPNNRTIVGFDRRGNVFLVGRAEGGIQWIERVRWRN